MTTYTPTKSPALKLKAALAGGLLVAGLMMSGAASAYDSVYGEWKTSAAKAIDKVMVYPASALTFGDEGTVLMEVRIDRAGKVVSSEVLENSGRNHIERAARTLLRDVAFPAIPAGHKADNMTFKLALNYLIDPTPREIRLLKQQREGKVSYEQLSANGKPRYAMIEIIDSE